jgi:hypothetical protein
MATILTKKRDTAGAPAVGDLTNAAGGAELAVNTLDKRLYTKSAAGAVVEIGTNPTIINVDNIQVDGNTISSTNTNGDINLTPNGTGKVVTSAMDINGGSIDGVTIGTNAVVTDLRVDNLQIDGNTISSTNGNGNIVLAPNGTGDVQLDADTVRVGDAGADATIASNGNADLILQTGNATTGSIRLYDGADGNINITPNGTGEVGLPKVNIDAGSVVGLSEFAVLGVSNETGNVRLSADIASGGFAQGGGVQRSGRVLSGSWFIDSTSREICSQTIDGTWGTYWKLILIGTGGEFYNGFGGDVGPTYREVDSNNTSFDIGSRTVTVTRNATTGRLEWSVAGIYNALFQGQLILIQSREGSKATSMRLISDFIAARVYPNADNTKTLGTASFRWSEVFAGNGTINTSDATEKEQVAELTDAERRVAARLKGLIRTYKFKDAVARKGVLARIHVGAVAQDVAAAFTAEGLNAGQYSMFCSDTWWELNGAPVERDAKTGEYPEGAIERTRLGLRYDEMTAFIISTL